jgi:hypothetical protein
VAVGAPYLTKIDLSHQAGSGARQEVHDPTSTLVQHLDMIELENLDVRLSAVHTRMAP